MAFKDFNVPEVGPQKPPVVDPSKQDPVKDMVDTLVQAKKQIAVINALDGVMNPNKPASQSPELTGTAVITKSIDALERQNAKVQEAIEKRDKDVEHARSEADKAKAEVLSITASQIGAAMDKLEKIRDEMKSSGQQKSLLDQLEEARKVGAILNPQPPAMKPPESDLSLSIALEKMRQAHDLEMKKLDIQLKQMSNDLTIKLAEMTDNSKWKERDWEDGKDFKKSALSQVSDIAAGIAAAFQARGGAGGPPMAAQPAPAPSPADEDVSAVIRSFPCQKCGGEVAIPEDANEVICPNPGCGVKYAINREHLQKAG